jgi:hypothetical protein
MGRHIFRKKNKAMFHRKKRKKPSITLKWKEYV